MKRTNNSLLSMLSAVILMLTAFSVTAHAAQVTINLSAPGTPGPGDGWVFADPPGTGSTIHITDPTNTYTLTGDAGGNYRV
jgi:hypothetical protein